MVFSPVAIIVKISAYIHQTEQQVLLELEQEQWMKQEQLHDTNISW